MTVDPHDDYQPEAPVHHEAPMRHQRSTHSWEGKPGEGFTVDKYYFTCRECTTTVLLEYRIPS